VARVHERLHKTRRIRTIDLGAFVTELCGDLDQVTTNCEVLVDAPEGMEIATDRALSDECPLGRICRIFQI
ncbi:MAG: hypothetical protein JWM91_4588, partial [Rhodospirillales bacterium]|nr:hypothetical protein [Rhodospirillales bacterium]